MIFSPEGFGQLRDADEANPVTPLRWSATPALHNLPLQLTRFVGREPELVHIQELMATERLVTLTGAGGIGKTRLAIEAAMQLRDTTRDGVWLVDLGPLAQPALLAQAIAEPLGVRTEGDIPLEQTLLAFLRRRDILLVLDNCEHLVQVCARLVDSILRNCADVHVLATSREPLHVPGERPWRVPSLLEDEAIRLFVDRAFTADRFVLTQANAAAVARVCQRLDGIPLAIELAAARTDVLSIEQIADRLDDRFRLLVGGSRTAPPRQQTLAAAIDWSYDLLSIAEQLVLCRLSVFAGGWTLEAAEHVCAGAGVTPEDILPIMAQLVDKSLVLTDPVDSGHKRYRLLESVRQYGQERLRRAGVPPRELHAAHADYYCALVEEVERRILWGVGDVEWLTRLDREQGNVRAALAWSLSPAGAPLTALRLAAHLGHYWYTRADRGEGRSWLARALARATRAGLPEGSPHAWALLWAGGLAHGQSEYESALPQIEQALTWFERLDDKAGIGWALHFLGNVARARADLRRAMKYHERAVDVFRDIDDKLSVILPLAALGFEVGALGDQDRATLLLQESVLLAKQSGSRGRIAIASLYFGQVAFAQGNVERAADAWREGLELSREWGSAWAMAECLEGLAIVAGADGRHARSARLLGAAARLRETCGAPMHPVDRPDHERTLSMVQAALGVETFTDLWTAARAAPLDEIIGEAVSSPVGASVDARAGASKQASALLLTSRERQVAVLIARGMRNREIAEQLVVTERTVTAHVEHILNKLGFRSRAQVATWVTEQRIPGDL